MPLLHGLYRACTGRFPGVASCTASGIFARSAPSGRLPGRHGSTVAVIPSPENPPIFRRSSSIVADRFLKIIVASHSRYQSCLKVAEESPESRKTSGGIFIVAIVAVSKSLAYFVSSASMILSASAPYTSSRYFRRRASGSLASPSGFSGFKTTSCWSV